MLAADGTGEDRVARDLAAHSLAGRVWAHRALAERVSSARYLRLARGLARAGVPRALVERAEGAAADERRHAELCEAMAVALGAEVDADTPPTAWRPLRDREDTLREAVAFCAVSESMNATLMAVALHRTQHEATRALLRTLLADEVQHARLGWAVVAFERGRGDCAALSSTLLPLLEQAVSEELREAGSQAAGATDEIGAGYGLLTAQERLALIAATLRDVVLPGLAEAGVDTAAARAWAQHHLPWQEASA